MCIRDRCDYIATFILFPHFLEDPFYIKDVRSFPGNERKIQEINRLLKNIRNYAKLSFREVEALAEELAHVVGVQEIYYENFYLKEMKLSLIHIYKGYCKCCQSKENQKTENRETN